MKRTTAFIVLIVLIIILLMMSCNQKPSTHSEPPVSTTMVGKIVEIRVIETQHKIYVREHDVLELSRTSTDNELQDAEQVLSKRSVCQATLQVSGNNYYAVYYDDVYNVTVGSFVPVMDKDLDYDTKTFSPHVLGSFAHNERY